MKEDILKMLCDDYRQKEIAEHLNISLKTLENHIRAMKKEYEVLTLSGLIHEYTKTILK